MDDMSDDDKEIDAEPANTGTEGIWKSQKLLPITSVKLMTNESIPESVKKKWSDARQKRKYKRFLQPPEEQEQKTFSPNVLNESSRYAYENHRQLDVINMEDVKTGEYIMKMIINAKFFI